MKKEYLDLFNAIINFFFEKIDAGVAFQNKRIEEWCRNMPTPRTSSLASSDKAALDRITELHNFLAATDARNTAKGMQWPTYVIDEFNEKCELMKALIAEKEVHQSIRNLYHYHKAIGLRAHGKYRPAIREIQMASSILQKAIEDAGPDQLLPRYSRNRILNKGQESEFKREGGDVRGALRCSDEMLSMSVAYERNPAFCAFERSEKLKPVKSFALYYCCQAHLAVSDWDDKSAAAAREWTFSEAFGQGHFRDWDVPLFVQILRNKRWHERYPHYYEQIANRIYVGTAKNVPMRFAREVSVLAGRIRIKPSAAALGAATVLIYVLLGTPEPRTKQEIGTQVELVLTSALDQVRQAQPGLRKMAEADVEKVRDQIMRSCRQIIDRSDDMGKGLHIDGDQKSLGLVNANTEDGRPVMLLTAALTGNQQGVGLG
jgi:hypothetical protein